MKLRKEYQDIVDTARRSFDFNYHALLTVVERCQALADSQPRKHLSDEEMLRAFDHAYPVPITCRRKPSANWFNGVRAVVAAAFEKQKEQPPEPLDFEKLKTGEWEVLCCGRPTAVICAATFAASPEHYTMRRKCG